MKFLRIIISLLLLMNIVTPSVMAQTEDEVIEVIESDTNEESVDAEEADEELPTCVEPEEEIVIEIELDPFTPHYGEIIITELLPDPVSPATDKDDEYVELFNPNRFSVDIENYALEAGIDFRYSFSLPSYTMLPGEYLSVFSVDSSLTLTNSGGMARLLGPDGEEMYITPQYERAQPGLSWALNSLGDWDWTVPTPHNENVFIEEDTQPDSDSATLTKRTPTGLSSVASIASEVNTATAERVSYIEPPASQTQELDNKLLVLTGIIALLYASYEYRKDITNFYLKLRRYIYLRRENRQ